MTSSLEPKLLSVLREGYTRTQFLADLSAGVTAGIVEKWIAFSQHAGTANLRAVAVGLVALAIIVLWPRVTHRIPGSLVAIVLVTAGVKFFQVPVDTIGSRFGDVPSHFPYPHVP